MEGVKPAPFTSNSVATPATPAAASAAAAVDSAESSSSSSSIVAHLFGKRASEVASSGGIFDAIFNAPAQRGVTRGNYASESWETKPSWQPKKTLADGSSQYNEGDGGVMSDKNLGLYSNKVVEHTFLGSSVHYGGRDDYIESSAAEEYPRTTTFQKGSGEDVSDGGSPRGNFWSGSFYY